MLTLIPATNLTPGDRLTTNGRPEQVRAIAPIPERPGCLWVWTRHTTSPHLFLPGDMVHVERHWADDEIQAIDDAADKTRAVWALLADGGWNLAAIRAAHRRTH